MFRGRVKDECVRWSDKLRSSGVGDGCTVQIMITMRGGGQTQKQKRTKLRRKPAASPKSQEPVRGQQQHDEEKNHREVQKPMQGTARTEERQESVEVARVLRDELIGHF